jgi:hypothetical protein
MANSLHALEVESGSSDDQRGKGVSAVYASNSSYGLKDCSKCDMVSAGMQPQDRSNKYGVPLSGNSRGACLSFYSVYTNSGFSLSVRSSHLWIVSAREKLSTTEPENGGLTPDSRASCSPVLL